MILPHRLPAIGESTVISFPAEGPLVVDPSATVAPDALAEG